MPDCRPRPVCPPIEDFPRQRPLSPHVGQASGEVTILVFIVGESGFSPPVAAPRVWYDAPMPDTLPILIAEDNEDDFHLFRRAVRQAHLQNPVLWFRDGSELTRFLEAQQPRPEDQPWLVFIDLTMPIMGGFEVLAWLRAHRVRCLPVVLSGSRRDEDIAKAFAAGAEEFLSKPLSPAVVAALAARAAQAPVTAGR